MQLHHVLALAAVSLAAVSDAQQQPQFDFSRSEDFFLSLTSVWEVGSPTRLAILMAADTSGKEIVVKLKGGNCTDRRTVFKYKCAGESGFQEKVLTTVAVNKDVALCGDEENLPLYLAKLNTEGTTYRTTVKQPESSRYTAAFDDKVELKVRVECKEATLMSNSLFVMNLDTVSQINAVSISRDYLQNFKRRFLTEDAVKFMITMNMPPSQEFATVDFIDRSIVNLIRKSPKFFRSKIGIGALMHIGDNKCRYIQLDKAFYFGSFQQGLYHSHYEGLKFMHLDLDNGKLTYSTYGLSNALSQFVRAQRTNKMSLCTRIGVNGEGVIFTDGSEVKDGLGFDRNVYKQYGSSNTNCKLAASTNSKKVTLFSGAQATYLACPIVCSQATALFTFNHKGVQIAHRGTPSYYQVDNGLEIHSSGKILKFPSVLTKSHAGIYRCEGGSVSFEFDVSVVSLPYFSRDAGLPKSVFAVEGESMSYSCTASFSNIDSVTVAPEFYTSYAEGSGGKWTKVDLAVFNSIVNPGGRKTVAVNPVQTEESKTLKIDVNNVPPNQTLVGKNFGHRFVCHASVSAEDAKKMGVSSYNMRNSSNVFFIPRPRISDFDFGSSPNCSDPQNPCSAAKGGVFEVSLSSGFSNMLRATGAEVRAHFRSEKLQSDFAGSGVSVSFDSATNRLALRVQPGIRGDLRQKLSALVPIFDFRYPAGTQLRDLRMLKEKYRGARGGCYRDPLCFYSTAFDADAGLRGLRLRLHFDGDDKPGADRGVPRFGSLLSRITAALLHMLSP